MCVARVCPRCCWGKICFTKSLINVLQFMVIKMYMKWLKFCSYAIFVLFQVTKFHDWHYKYSHNIHVCKWNKNNGYRINVKFYFESSNPTSRSFGQIRYGAWTLKIWWNNEKKVQECQESCITKCVLINKLSTSTVLDENVNYLLTRNIRAISYYFIDHGQ